MVEQTSIKLVESFPFTSSDGGYDADGYPVYDRAVGSDVLRATFREFFSDGVFPSTGTALQIGKGEGLSVTIEPGAYIIEGAMGWVDAEPLTLTLDTSAPQGNVAYGIMLRYDENINDVDGVDVGRSLSIRVVRGEASASPTPPEPDQSTPGVMEYRLGYVTVPTGATDLSGATVTNEKGLSSCPYAAPFEEIDLSQVTADAKESASEALSRLLAYFGTYEDMVDAAVDETLAGQLQTQINQLKAQLDDFDLSGSVDNVTIEYANVGGLDDKLTIKDGSITPDKMSQSTFSDTADSSQSVADKVAATPKCVDEKIKKTYSHAVSGSVSGVSQGTYVNWSAGTLTVEGFEIVEDGIKSKIDGMLIFNVTACSRNDSSSFLRFYIDDDKFYETSSLSSSKTIFLMVAIAADSTIKIESYNDMTDITTLSIQSV